MPSLIHSLFTHPLHSSTSLPADATMEMADLHGTGISCSGASAMALRKQIVSTVKARLGIRKEV